MSDPSSSEPASSESSWGEPWPTELRLTKDRHALVVSFEGGASYTLPAEYLRVESPSAEVQGHAPHEKVTVPGKRMVKIVHLDPVGTYAVRLVFDDGHQTGLYTWTLLNTLGREQEQRFAGYLQALEAQGLSRG